LRSAALTTTAATRRNNRYKQNERYISIHSDTHRIIETFVMGNQYCEPRAAAASRYCLRTDVRRCMAVHWQ
jgi:hypothetical protein